MKSTIYDRAFFTEASLIELDYALAFGWDPPWLNQRQLIWDLSTTTQILMRKWLQNPSTPQARR